jgi:hypothetical protein
MPATHQTTRFLQQSSFSPSPLLLSGTASNSAGVDLPSSLPSSFIAVRIMRSTPDVMISCTELFRDGIPPFSSVQEPMETTRILFSWTGGFDLSKRIAKPRRKA